MVHIILFSSVILAIICSRVNKVVQIYPFVLLFLFASLRYMYGNDYQSYYYNFLYIQAGSKSPYDEILFTFLNKAFPNFFILIAVISFAFIFIIYKVIKDNLPMKYYWLGLLIFVINPYLFLMNLSSVRQCIAMLLFIVAINFAIERKILPYMALIAVAVLFHKSAVLLFPIYFVCTDKKFKRRWVLLILIAILALLSLDNFQSIVSQFTSWFNDKDYNYFAQQNMQNSLRATILTGMFFAYVLFNLPRLNGRALVFSKLYLIGTILGVLAMKMSMLTRFQMYFDIFSVVALPMIFINTLELGPIVVNRNNAFLTFWDCINKYAMPAVLLIIYILRYYSFFTNSMWSSFVNYHTIFEVL